MSTTGRTVERSFDWAALATMVKPPTADDVTVVDGVEIHTNEQVRELVARFGRFDIDD